MGEEGEPRIKTDRTDGTDRRGEEDTEDTEKGGEHGGREESTEERGEHGGERRKNYGFRRTKTARVRGWARMREEQERKEKG